MPLYPIFDRSADTTKSASDSTRRIPIPLCAGTASTSVLQSSAISPERHAFVIHIFDPEITHESPSRRATVRIAWRSDPPPGSVSATAARNSPVAMVGRYRRRCSSVPNWWINFDTMEWPPNAPARLIHPRASSSVTRTKQGVDTPNSPYGSGMHMP